MVPLTLFAASLLLASHVMSSMGIYLCVAPEYSVTVSFAFLLFCTHLGFSVFTMPCVPLFVHLLACGCVQRLSGQYSSQVIQSAPSLPLLAAGLGLVDLQFFGVVRYRGSSFTFPCGWTTSALPHPHSLFVAWAVWIPRDLTSSGGSPLKIVHHTEAYY